MTVINQCLDDPLRSQNGPTAAGKSLADQARFRFVFWSVKSGTNLADFADRDNVGDVVKLEVLECKWPAGTPERLHFVRDEGDVVLVSKIDE